MKRPKFDFGNGSHEMTIDTTLVIDNAGERKLNSSGNAIRVKNNPILLWKHKNDIALRPHMEESFKVAREHLSKKMLEEVDAIFKETQKMAGSVPPISGEETY